MTVKTILSLAVIATLSVGCATTRPPEPAVAQPAPIKSDPAVVALATAADRIQKRLPN